MNWDAIKEDNYTRFLIPSIKEKEVIQEFRKRFIFFLVIMGNLMYSILKSKKNHIIPNISGH
jgi:hypothetical protein